MTGRHLTTELERVLGDAGGARAPRERHAQIRAALDRALARGRAELGERRSGYGSPVEVVVAAGAGALIAAVPAPLALRVDPAAGPERAWLLVAGVVAGLADASGLPAPARGEDLALRAGEHAGFLVLELPARDPDAELAALAIDERLANLDRLRARARAVPAGAIHAADLRVPASAGLRTAEAVARLGGNPSDPASVDALEAPLLALLPPVAGRVAPHDEPDPSLRIARRIVQRLDGMGKWGGYHTAFEHLSRGFAGNERERANAVGEALLAAGLLRQKPSVGQRHVFLDPRRAAEIHALIRDGAVPPDLRLP